jgi:hypothetical protein
MTSIMMCSAVKATIVLAGLKLIQRVIWPRWGK